MCLFSDHEIQSMMQSGSLRIVGFAPEGLTPNGYDLRVAEVRMEDNEDSEKEGTILVPARSMFYVSTLERVELPNDVAAQLWARTSWIRKGVMVGLGKVDAGFRGTLTFTAFNASGKDLELPIGSRFVQIVFERMHSPVAQTYEKRSGNYQNQSGVTLAPIKKP
jgi:dCTP deaminase